MSGLRQGLVPFILIICLFATIFSGIAVQSVQDNETQSNSIGEDDLSQQSSIKFWRADPDQFKILESNIFPMLTISSSSNFENLGKVWITWQLNVSGKQLGMFAIYDQGEIRNFTIINQVYSEISWFGVQNQLFFIGVSEENTQVSLYSTDTQTYSFTINKQTQDHKVFVSQTQFFIYASDMNGSSAYYSTDGLSITEQKTDERVLDTAPTMAIIKTALSNIIYTTDQNITVPISLSTNVAIGHQFLVPTVYDLENNIAWNNERGEFELPERSQEIFFYGLQSSIVRTEDNQLFELGPNGWEELLQLNNQIFSFGLIDINLYVGTTPDNGLSLIVEGTDEDNDNIPNTMEDYYGTFPTIKDSDNDGIDDGSEIRYGLDPMNNDSHADYDNDRLTNKQEINVGTDPLAEDTDYGGALDAWELKYDYNPLDPFDDEQDDDQDGIINAIESRWGTDPNSKDSDGDGLPDKWEIQYQLDPTDSSNANEDPDRDGITNLEEYTGGTDPLVKDDNIRIDEDMLELGAIIVLVLIPSILTYRKIFSK